MHFNRLAQWLRIPAIALFSIFLASCDSGSGKDSVDASDVDTAIGQLRVIFRDDFGGPAAASPRTAGKLSAQPLPLDNWVVETGYGENGWGNDEWQLYQNSIGNLFIENNSLVIRARCVNAPACGKQDGSITSARITTKDRLNVRNGNIKARIKMPSGAGMWPAFWTLGADIDERPWPDAGEIDIVEMHYFYSDTRTTHFSTHWSGPKYTDENRPDCASNVLSFLDPDEEENCNTTNKEFDEPLTDGFHIYELDWSDNQIIGKIDGITYFTQAIDPATMEEFLKDHFLILNVAVGGTLGGPPGPAMSAADWADPDQTDMLVDWVEVSERVPSSTGTLIDESGNNLPYNRIINSVEFGGGFVDSDLDSSAVQPLVGDKVLELNYSKSGSPNGGGVPAPFSGAVFDFNSIDLSKFTKLVFSIDVSQFTHPDNPGDLAELGIEFQDSRFNGFDVFAGQAIRDLFSYPSEAAGGFWQTYEIPLSDFVGANLDQINALVFGNPRDANGNLLSGTLYLDDIRFVTESCTDPALVSFGAAGYRPTDFSGSVSVSNPCAPSSLAKVMLVTGEEEIVLGVDLNAAGEGSASFDICPVTNDEDTDIGVTDGVGLEAFYTDLNGNILSSDLANIDSTIPGPPAPVFVDDFDPGPAGRFDNFGGGETQLIPNPVVTADNNSPGVARMWKFADQPFGGTALVYDNPIPLAASNQIFTMKVWSSRAVEVTFKLEFPTPPGGIPDGSGVSKLVTTSGITGWETLTFDFSGDVLSTVVDNKIVLIFDDGTVGNANDDVINGTTEWTFYYDDIELGKGDGPNPNCTPPPAVVDGGTGLGVFSETNIDSTVTVNDIVSAGNTVVIDANSTAITPFDGNVVLALIYSDNTEGNFFGGAVFEFDDADLRPYNTLKFTIDTSQFADFANLTLQLEPPGGGTAGGNVALAAYTPVATSGDWNTYEIPLDDFTAVDLSLVNRLGFFNARDGGDVLLAGTLYLDDIYFVFVSRAADCDGSSPCGVYSETNTTSAVSINDIVSAGNTVVIDANSTAVTPFDGNFVLSLDYQAGGNGFGGAIFTFDAVDITVYDTLKFTIDTSAVTDFANLTVQLEPPPGGTAGGNVLLGGYTPVATSGNWNTYEIPLADFTAVTGTAVTALGFFNLSDSAGLTTGTIYLDDIHFLTVGGGTGGGCDGSNPCGVYSETNTTSTVSINDIVSAGNTVVIDANSTAVTPFDGSVVLSLEYQAGGNGFGGAIFEFDAVDITVYDTLKFTIDTSAVTDFANLVVQLEPPPGGTAGGNVLLGGYTPVATSGNWNTYEIPLADFTAVTGTATTALGFFNLADSAGLTTGTIYLDDIHFLTLGGGTGGGCDGSNPCGVYSETNTTSAVSINDIVSAGNTVVIDANSTAVTPFDGSVVLSLEYQAGGNGFGGAIFEFDAVDITVYDTLKFTIDTSAVTDFANLVVQLEPPPGGTAGGNVLLGGYTPVATSGNWNTYEIPLADFTAVTGTAVTALGFFNLADSAGLTTGTIYLDDIHFLTVGGGTTPGNDLPFSDDFESGDLAGWTATPNGGTIAADDTQAGGGTYSARMVAGPSQAPALSFEGLAAGSVMPGDTIDISWDMCGSFAGGGEVLFPALLSEPGGGAGAIRVFDTIGSVPDVWTRYTRSFTADAGAGNVDAGVSIQFDVVCGGDAGCAADVFFDNVDVTNGAGDPRGPNSASGLSCDSGNTGGGDGSEPLGVFSENTTSSVTVNNIATAGNPVVVDANSTAVTPFEGSVVLSLEYQAGGNGFGGAIFEFDAVDITVYDTLKFTIDTSAVTDFANLVVQLEPPPGGTAGGNVLLGGYTPVATSGNWNTYEIPLADFTAVTGTAVTALGFFNLADSAGLTTGTIYLDDIQFVTLGGDCDGSSPCGVYSETNTTSTVTVNNIAVAGNPVVVDDSSTAVTPFEGSVVLSLEYQAGGNGFGGAIFEFAAVDITVYDTLKFTIDTSAVTDFANLVVQLEPPPGGTAGGNVLLGGYTPVATSGNWNTYEIPLADFTAVTGTAVTALGFFNLADSAGLTTGTIYLDDIHFLTVGGGTGGGCDGSSPCGVFSETNTSSTVTVNDIVTAGNTVVIDANSTAVTPFEGSVVLSLEYQSGGNGFGGAIFEFAAVDITVYDTLKFTIDTSAVTDFANLVVQLEPPPGGTAGGNVLLGGYTPVATSGNWNTYEIPLADFTAVTGTAVTALGFFNLADSAGLTTGTIYLDDIHFLTVGGGTGGGCDGSSPCGVFSETNTTSTVNVTGTTGDAGNLVEIDPASTAVTPFDGSVVLSLDFTTAAGPFGGAFFTFDPVDITVYDTVKFTIDTSAVTDFANLTIQIEPPPGGTPGGNVLLADYTPVATSGNWETYEIPLAAFTSVPGTATTALGFWNLSDSAGLTTGTIYLDDIHFLTLGGGGASGELVPDGGFESVVLGVAPWFGFPQNGLVEISSAQAQSGSQSAHLVADVDGNGGASFPQLKVERVGQGSLPPGPITVTVSFDLYGTSTPTGLMVAEFFSEFSGGGAANEVILNAGGGSVPTTTGPLNGWTRYSFPVTTAADIGGGLSLLFKADCGGVAGCVMDVYIDNVSIVAP